MWYGDWASWTLMVVMMVALSGAVVMAVIVAIRYLIRRRQLSARAASLMLTENVLAQQYVRGEIRDLDEFRARLASLRAHREAGQSCRN